MKFPLPLPWSIAATAIVGVPLLAVTGILVARLIGTARPAAAPPPATTTPTRKPPTPQPTLVAAIEAGRRRSRLVVDGAPGTTVLVTLDSRPWRVLTLDANGHGEATVVHKGEPPRIQVFSLGEGVLAEVATPAPTPASSPTPLPTVIPTPTGATKPTSGTAATQPPVTPTAPPTSSRPTPTSAPRSVEAEPTRIPDLLMVRDGGARLALTFDAGSTADGTAQLLALFRRLHLRPTLFMTGLFIRSHPALVRQAVLDGHEIGNHLLTHPHLTTYAENRRQQLLPNVTRPWFKHQLLDTERLFFQATGRRMAPLWRAPYGEENSTLRSWAYELGYLHVRWSSLHGTSLDSRDWVADEHSSLYEDPDRMMKRLLGFPHLEGGIVLMHLATHRSEPPWEVLPRLVAKLRARGIELGSVTSLLEHSPSWRPRLEGARRRFQARQKQAQTTKQAAAGNGR